LILQFCKAKKKSARQTFCVEKEEKLFSPLSILQTTSLFDETTPLFRRSTVLFNETTTWF